MRDIEFRAKRVDNGKWVFGSLIDDGLNFTITPKDGGMYHDVYPETIGQYTGLKDMNDVKIFEGDIVKVHYFRLGLGENLGAIEVEEELTGIIEYGDLGLWLGKIKDKNGKWCEYTGYDQGEGSCEFIYLHDVYDETADEYNFEVIGNIYDKPK